MIVLCVFYSVLFLKVIESSGSDADNYVSALVDYFNNSNSRFGIFYNADLVKFQRLSDHLVRVTIGVNVGAKHNKSIKECNGDVSSESGTPIVEPETVECQEAKSKNTDFSKYNNIHLDTHEIDSVNSMRSIPPKANKMQRTKLFTEFTAKPTCDGCSHIKPSSKEVDLLVFHTIKQMNKNNPGLQHELKSILSAQRRIINADSASYSLHTSVEFKNCSSLFVCWYKSKKCRIDFLGRLDWFQNSDRNKLKGFNSWNCTDVYLPKGYSLVNDKMRTNAVVQKRMSTNSNKLNENQHQSDVERKQENLNINNNGSKVLTDKYNTYIRDSKTKISMLRKRRACPRDEIKHEAFLDPEFSESINVDVKTPDIVNLLDYIVSTFNNVTQAGTMYQLEYVDDVRKKVYIGGITRYVVKFNINNGLEYLHCHSQTLTNNSLVLTSSSNITCMKKNTTAGYNLEDPGYPKFRQMAQESLMNYDAENYIYRVKDIHNVKTQVLAGYITYIEFTALPTNCTRNLHLSTFDSSCTVTNQEKTWNCNSRILVKNWLDKTQNDITCKATNVAPSILRNLKQIISLKRFGEDIFKMAMQALNKFIKDNNLVYKHKIIDIKTVDKEKVSGTLTNIVFDTAATFCALSDKNPVTECNVDESLPIKTCHAEIWDLQILHDRIINVNCHVHNSKTVEVVEEVDHLNDGNLGAKLIKAENLEEEQSSDVTVENINRYTSDELDTTNDYAVEPTTVDMSNQDKDK